MNFNKALKQCSVFAIILFALYSCVPYKKIVYMDDDKVSWALDTTVYKIQVGDRIGIQITSSVDVQAGNNVFDRQLSDIQEDPTGSPVNKPLEGFRVTETGSIELPLVGSVHVQGYTLTQVDSILSVRLKEYVSFTHVKTALYSYRITMLGEFRLPNTFAITQPDVNLLQAIGMAGDFTDYANKKKIKVYRREGNQYKLMVLNLSGTDYIEGSRFMLHPGDVVYAVPLRAKTMKANSVTISMVVALVSVTILVLNQIR